MTAFPSKAERKHGQKPPRPPRVPDRIGKGGRLYPVTLKNFIERDHGTAPIEPPADPSAPHAPLPTLGAR